MKSVREKDIRHIVQLRLRARYKNALNSIISVIIVLGGEHFQVFFRDRIRVLSETFRGEIAFADDPQLRRYSRCGTLSRWLMTRCVIAPKRKFYATKTRD